MVWPIVGVPVSRSPQKSANQIALAYAYLFLETKLIIITRNEKFIKIDEIRYDL